jgi:hypothetical protein
MSDKARLLDEFELFRGNGGGIEAWFTDRIPETVVDVLLNCEKRPISCEVLSQLLILSHEGGIDLPLKFHPAAIRASAVDAPFGAESWPA